MQTIDRNSRARSRGSRWLTAAVTVAAIASGGVALATPAAAAAEPSAAVPTAGAETEPVKCPSENCNKAVVDELGDPYSVALDGQGHAYVADNKNGELVRVDLATGKKETIVSGLGGVESAALDGKGNAYVASRTRGELYRVDLSGPQYPIAKVASGLGRPRGVAVKDDGKVIVTDWLYDRVLEVDPSSSGSPNKIATVASATGVAIDPSGVAYVTSSQDEALYRLDLNAARGPELVADRLGHVHDVALRDGHAYVGDDGGDAIWDVDLASHQKHKAATGGGFRGVAVDKDGGLYATDEDNKTLWRINGSTPAPPPPPSDDAKVDLKPVPDITAKPGGSAVPRIYVKNTGGKRIGNQDITLKLGPEGVKWGFNVVYQDRDGDLVETPCHVVDGDAGTSLCKDVPLNLDPGQSVQLRTEVGTSASLKPGDMPSITWHIADKTAKTDWLMK
ncbi:hypothetical protein [Streptomyces marispadix]|uniref:Uncharacterized protein n=1 Tax=Streptomyces marispadix TaxID=2922868 RepID=A0ABS9T421_9ACTN|nr:hypothetical protein [Streptomyces marispadix]MCH6163011.1 hypothetical protein [Streptomyces marispadix]